MTKNNFRSLFTEKTSTGGRITMESLEKEIQNEISKDRSKKFDAVDIVLIVIILAVLSIGLYLLYLTFVNK